MKIDNTSSFITIQQVTKSYATRIALDNIDLNIPHGKIIAVAGPDGAGKTTLIRLIAGLLIPDKGLILVEGLNTVTDAQEISHLIGYMPQRFGLYDEMSVMQNLTLYADLKGISGNEKKESFEKLLAFTGLSHFSNRLAGNLSGGMKQKLGLACALLGKPKLLLLDEPSVGVDPISRRELWKIVEGLVSDGITILWSTSYLDEAEKSQMALLLNEGKLLYQGPPQELTKRTQGRVFKISGKTENRREILRNVFSDENVMDSLIQGSEVRFVTKTEFTEEDLKRDFGKNVSKTSSRFEDAFVDILGGSKQKSSQLAHVMPQIEKNGQAVIEAKNLTKKFGTFVAADHVTFTVQRGEIFGLLGPNGAGKSTTFKMMCGLLKPTLGDARVLGYDLQTARGNALSHIGYMAQKFSLYGDLSVIQNLDFFSGIYGLYGKKKKERIQQMIEIFHFNSLLNTSSKDLPLGFKQRLSMACSLMHYPEVLFLDEPTSGVDPITRREFWNHINAMVEKGITVVVTTHFMDEAEYCDRIGLIYQSKLINVDTPDKLKEMSKTENNPSPTLEDAFIYLIESYGEKNKETGTVAK